MNNYSVSIEDKIWFRIPFTVYWVGYEGGDKFIGICFYRKCWDSKAGEYFWTKV